MDDEKKRLKNNEYQRKWREAHKKDPEFKEKKKKDLYKWREKKRSVNGNMIETIETLKSKIEARKLGNDMINDIFNQVLQTIPNDAKRGRKPLQLTAEEIIQRRKDYYQRNREKILEQVKARKQALMNKITCECGSVISIFSLTTHKKSKKHQAFMEQEKERNFL